VLGRFLEGLMPPSGGGALPIVGVARARLSGFVYGAIGLGVGAATGLLLVLILFSVHGISSLLAGFAAGALVGSALAVVLASRYPLVRKGGGIAILLLPLLLLAAPFLLIALAVAALVRTAPASSRVKDAVVILPRPSRHRP
jgi:hypothetical protein